MEGILGIILIAVIGLISAAVKSSKKSGNTRGESEGQPQRSVPLSDIQRAFMMTQDSAPQPPPQPSARPVYSPPQQPAPRPAYTAAQQTAYTPMQARTMAPLEGRMNAPLQARTAVATPPHPMYAAQQAAPRPVYSPPQPIGDPLCAAASKPPLDFYGGSMGDLTVEGRGNAVMDEQPLESVRAAVESVADMNLETITDLDSPVLSVRKEPGKPVRKGMPVKLFENKNEFVKAVIYAEILAPRSRGARRA